MKTRSSNIHKISIAALWLAFVIATNILVFRVVKGQIYEQAKNDLLCRAEIVAGHIPSIVENDISTQIGKAVAENKLEALAYVLDQTDDIRESGDYINKYAETAGMDVITIYDSDGKIV